MNEPLNQFADRIIRNYEVETFIKGLIEKGVSPCEIIKICQEYQDKTIRRSNTTFGLYRSIESENWLQRERELSRVN